ncbi:MAG: hypothetical protein BRD31_01660 [Bacteroidetes bacterium QH_2_64_26]|nr:MAG: hypothetical protein BRD31_01660 [Bacteroidetes bacterium QH_2_64_26]
MNTEHRNVTVDAKRSVTVEDLPFREGETVEVFIVRRSPPEFERSGTASRLRSSPLAGLWADRSDLPDSLEYARFLREKAQKRHE